MSVIEALSPSKHAYGWKRPLPGRGALDLLPHVDTSGLPILPEVDPRPHMPPALNQGQLGSCTANATARCFRYDTIMDGKDCGELSRRWIYHFEKVIERTHGQGDTGAEGHDAFTVAKHGIPDESLYPYSEDIEAVEAKPPDVEPRAYTLKKPVHAVPQNLNQIKQALSNKQTIAYGFTVYRDFEEPWLTEGEMPEPDPSEEVMGGHENLLCGYLKDYPGFLLSLNSWGTQWGVFGGYFLFPIATFLNPSITADLRTIVRAV
jgi:C1A family cysteine protease